MNVFESMSRLISERRGLRHFLFWFGMFLFFMTKLYLDKEVSFLHNLIWFTIQMTPTIAVSYYLAYYWIPKLSQKKKYFRATVSFVVVAYLSTVIFRLTTVYVGEPLTLDTPFEQEPVLEILTDIVKLFTYYFISIYYTAVLFLFAKYYSEFGKIKEKQLSLEKNKAENELRALRSQLNPHFLFNTLNNIYSLSIQNSPKAPDSIAKLSEILDHLLYKCNAKFVPLSLEVSLLENYISLEKLRYDERLRVNFETQIEDDILIAPLVLLSLVENAFKHGAGEDNGLPNIDIKLTQNRGDISFVISNSVSTISHEKKRQPIGLINIKKQLDLIYLDSFNLVINESDNIFQVKLNIKTKAST